MVKATVFSYSFGCADACEWVGSIDLKLHNGSAYCYPKGLVNSSLLSQEVSEVCNGVVLVADELRLSLATNVLLAIDIRNDGWDLTVCKTS